MRKITLVYHVNPEKDSNAKFGIETAVDSVVHFQLSGTQDANGVLKIPKTGTQILLLHPTEQNTVRPLGIITPGIAYAKKQDAFADIRDKSKGLNDFLDDILDDLEAGVSEQEALEEAVHELDRTGVYQNWALTKIRLP